MRLVAPLSVRDDGCACSYCGWTVFEYTKSWPRSVHQVNQSINHSISHSRKEIGGKSSVSQELPALVILEL